MWRLMTTGLPEADARSLAEALSEDDLAAVSVSFFEEDAAPLWRVEALFADEPDRTAIDALATDTIGRVPDWDLSPLPDRNWVALSLASLGPVRVGRFILHGSHDRDSIPPGRIGLEIEASLAFGTGHHGTTRGCLEALGNLAKAVPRPRGILDIGTGTGVLAIAAARQFREPALASDIDPVSVRFARANARLNGAGTLVETIEAAGLEHRRFRERAPYDLVFANILARPLTTLAEPLRPLMAPGGVVILSGLLPEQEGWVFAAWRARGFTLVQRIRRAGWSTLVLGYPGRMTAGSSFFLR